MFSFFCRILVPVTLIFLGAFSCVGIDEEERPSETYRQKREEWSKQEERRKVEKKEQEAKQKAGQERRRKERKEREEQAKVELEKARLEREQQKRLFKEAEKLAEQERLRKEREAQAVQELNDPKTPRKKVFDFTPVDSSKLNQSEKEYLTKRMNRINKFKSEPFGRLFFAESSEELKDVEGFAFNELKKIKNDNSEAAKKKREKLVQVIYITKFQKAKIGNDEEKNKFVDLIIKQLHERKLDFLEILNASSANFEESTQWAKEDLHAAPTFNIGRYSSEQMQRAFGFESEISKFVDRVNGVTSLVANLKKDKTMPQFDKDYIYGLIKQQIFPSVE